MEQNNNANNTESAKTIPAARIELEQEDGMTLMQLLHIIKCRFWIVILFVILAVGAAVGYLMVTVPTYESSATALVSPITNTSSLDSLLGASTSSSKIQTEVSLITSEKNIDAALKLMDLHTYTDEDGLPYDMREWPITGRSLIRNGKVTVSTVKDTNVVKITVSDSNPQFCRDLVNALVQSFSEVLTSIAKNSKTAQRVFLEEQIPQNEERLVLATKNLADFKQESGILQISEKNKILSTNVSNLQLQQEPLRHQQVEQQALYEGYGTQLKALGFDVPSMEELSKLYGVSVAMENIFGWYQELLMYQALGLAENNGTSSSRAYILNSSIANSQKSILTIITSDLKSRIVTTDQSAVQLRSLYAQSIVQLLMIEENISAINQIKDYYMQELSLYPDIERQSEELLRSVEVYQTLGVRLREMYEETKLLEAAISGYVTEIDSGNLPVNPVSPNKLLILAVSVLLGGCLGILIVLYANHKDVSIHDSATVKEILGPTVPELGWIPLLNKSYRQKHGSRLVTVCAPDSFASERINIIASNAYYSTDAEKIKIIGVNSASKGEGKTSLVCNLAVSYAEMGKKVLLIDGDLRNSSTEKEFGLQKAKAGIADLVVDKFPYESVIIRPIENLENLNLICSGHVTKNPAMIFSSTVFRQFLKYAKKNYDLILVDAPPVSVSPEFASIVSCLDGLIVNIRAGITNKPDLNVLVDNIRLIGGTIIGFVYNGVLVNDRQSSYSYYGKGGYSYSYNSYSYSKSNYNEGRSSFDAKMIIRSRRLNRTYKRVYNEELAERSKVLKDDSDLVPPRYLKDFETAAGLAGSGGGVTSVVNEEKQDHGFVCDGIADKEGAVAEVDILEAIEKDEAAAGKAPEKEADK